MVWRRRVWGWESFSESLIAHPINNVSDPKAPATLLIGPFLIESWGRAIPFFLGLSFLPHEMRELDKLPPASLRF